MLVRNRTLLYNSAEGEIGEKTLRVRVDVSLIKCEVRGSGTLVVSGTTDIPNDSVDPVYFTIGGISVTDFSKHVSLTDGMYDLSVAGLSYLKFNLNSACDVYLTEIG